MTVRPAVIVNIADFICTAWRDVSGITERDVAFMARSVFASATINEHTLAAQTAAYLLDLDSIDEEQLAAAVLPPLFAWGSP